MRLLKALFVVAVTTRAVTGLHCEHQWEGEFANHHVDGVPYLQARQNISPPPLDIQPLIVNGPSRNRVDIIFFGDGYTKHERDKFFADAMFLAANITDGHSFADVLPVMNFWAGFSPSVQSGVGVGGQPKDTVYGLYRRGTELRAVVSSKPGVIRAACQSTDACDYPIVLGNDHFYGGMGGKFVIVTASPHNGPLILRHELGHTIIDVGEEYDGGRNYSGVNSATDLSVPWTQWQTDPSLTDVKIQRTNMPLHAYPWKFLDMSQSWSQTFTSAGAYNGYMIQFSVSGVTVSSDLKVEIDGTDLGWEANTAVGLDRWIYDIKIDEGLSPGTHELAFTLLNEARQGSAQLCSVEVVEIGDDDEFNSEAGYYGLYPTFDYLNRTTYRPTNNFCIMRNMQSEDFCSVCMEGLWLKLLGRLSFTERITQVTLPDDTTLVTLELLPLAQFRHTPGSHKEAYSIFWFDARAGGLLPEWTNCTSAIIGKDVTEFSVEIRFSTEQVKIDKDGILVQRTNYLVGGGGGPQRTILDWQDHLFRKRS